MHWTLVNSVRSAGKKVLRQDFTANENLLATVASYSWLGTVSNASQVERERVTFCGFKKRKEKKGYYGYLVLVIIFLFTCSGFLGTELHVISIFFFLHWQPHVRYKSDPYCGFIYSLQRLLCWTLVLDTYIYSWIEWRALVVGLKWNPWPSRWENRSLLTSLFVSHEKLWYFYFQIKCAIKILKTFKLLNL